MPIETRRSFDKLLAYYAVGQSCVTPDAAPVSIGTIVKTLARVIAMLGETFKTAQDTRWQQICALHERLWFSMRFFLSRLGPSETTVCAIFLALYCCCF